MRLILVLALLVSSFGVGFSIGLGSDLRGKKLLKQTAAEYQTIQGRWCKKSETPAKDGCIDGSGNGG